MNTASVASDARAVVEVQLAERICVRPPYFALRDFSWGPDELSANASAEFPSSAELGPMHAAELGRHGAIAGLCAAALSQKDSARRYYLATKALYRGFFSRARYGSMLTFTARVDELTKRSARSSVTACVLGSGEQVMQLSVEYLVLTEATFERLYRQRRQETERAERFVLPQSIHQSPEVRTIAAVQPSLCVGHFENFPALPLAIILWEIGQIAADLFAEPFWLREASIDAHDLCWAGESARFEASLGPRDTAPNSGCSYVGRASSGSQSLAELRAELAPQPRDSEASSPELL